MSAKPSIGKGTLIGYGATEGTYTNVAKIIKIKPPGTKVGKAETTASDDDSEQFIPGWESGTDAKVTVLYLYSTTVLLSALVGVMQWFCVTTSDGGTREFEGWISEYDPDTPMKQANTEEVTITLTGVPIYTPPLS